MSITETRMKYEKGSRLLYHRSVVNWDIDLDYGSEKLNGFFYFLPVGELASEKTERDQSEQQIRGKTNFWI